MGGMSGVGTGYARDVFQAVWFHGHSPLLQVLRVYVRMQPQ